jgi:hypothetical protein
VKTWLAALALSAVPNPPGDFDFEIRLVTSCEEVLRPAFEPELEGHLCAGSDSAWYFTETVQRSTRLPACWKVVAEPVSDCAPRASLYDPSPDDAPAPAVDPDFDEHSPTGPGPGPPGATTGDKP